MVLEHYPGTLPAANVRTGLRILLADDHEMVRVAMRYALGGLADAIEWVEASDTAQAQAILERDARLDLALLDINMPGGGDGIGWIRCTRQRHPTLPLLVMSADEDPRTV